MAEEPPADESVARYALRDALQLLDAAWRGTPASLVRAHRAQEALLQEGRRLRAAAQAHVHLDAVALACAQLAEGLSPGPIKLAACTQILGAHLRSTHCLEAR